MNPFTITYTIRGAFKSAAESNDDLDLVTVERDGRYTVTLRAKKDVQLTRFTETYPFAIGKDDRYFFNGYQSWTDTKLFTPAERERNVYKLPRFLVNAFSFDRYGDATFYDYGANRLHGYDVFYSFGAQETFILNHNYARAYLVVTLDKKAETLTLSSDFDGYPVVAGETFTVADYYRTDNVEDGMAYFNAAFPRKHTPKIFGYTSWYNYYQNIDEQTLLRDLEALDGKFDLFQIDDGYQTKVGDWLKVDPAKFPRGLKPIVDAIHAKGFKAGIWLAPFVAEEKSELFATRKDLFRRDGNGDFVKCGANWSGFYALDLENADARAYIRRCLTHYADMGFDFFKLDFLYAANLVPARGLTRSMTAERAYAFLRECLPDKIILGCGATPFNCIDKFDYLRVGPDVSLIFDDVWYMRKMHRERISTRVTLQNTVYRAFMNDRLFGNDPDVFLLRDFNCKLSKPQRNALLTINALFGNVLMTSDNVGEYDAEKRAALAAALELFYRAEVTDYTRKKNVIEISYTLDGKTHTVRYHTEKGVLL